MNKILCIILLFFVSASFSMEEQTKENISMRRVTSDSEIILDPLEHLDLPSQHLNLYRAKNRRRHQSLENNTQENLTGYYGKKQRPNKKLQGNN